MERFKLIDIQEILHGKNRSIQSPQETINDVIADEALLCIDYTAGVILFPTDSDYDTYALHLYCKDPDRLGVIRQRLAAVGVSVDFVAGPAVEMDIYCPGKFCSE